MDEDALSSGSIAHHPSVQLVRRGSVSETGSLIAGCWACHADVKANSFGTIYGVTVQVIR